MLEFEPEKKGRPRLPRGAFEHRQRQYRDYVRLLAASPAEIAAITGLTQKSANSYLSDTRARQAPSQRVLDTLWAEIQRRRGEVIRRQRAEVNRLAYELAKAKTDLEALEEMAA